MTTQTTKEREQMLNLCGELYQVVGRLADMAGIFETSQEVELVLDVLSAKTPWKHKKANKICPFNPRGPLCKKKKQ